MGIAQASLNASIAYSNERIQFGKPISKNQAIQFKITDMEMEIEASLVYSIFYTEDLGYYCEIHLIAVNTQNCGYGSYLLD